MDDKNVFILLNAPLTNKSYDELISKLDESNSYELIIQASLKQLKDNPEDLYKKPSNCRCNTNSEISYSDDIINTDFNVKQADHNYAISRMFTELISTKKISFSCTTVERSKREIHYELDEDKNLYPDPPKEKSPASCPKTSAFLLPIIKKALDYYKITEEQAINFTSHRATFCADVTAFLSAIFGIKKLQLHASFQEYETKLYNKEILSNKSWFLDKSKEHFPVNEFIITEAWIDIIKKYNTIIESGKKIGKKIILIEDPCGNDFDDIIVRYMALQLFEEVILINTIYGLNGEPYMNYILKR